jgi:hypothetical protein
MVLTSFLPVDHQYQTKLVAAFSVSVPQFPTRRHHCRRGRRPRRRRQSQRQPPLSRLLRLRLGVGLGVGSESPLPGRRCHGYDPSPPPLSFTIWQGLRVRLARRRGGVLPGQSQTEGPGRRRRGRGGGLRVRLGVHNSELPGPPSGIDGHCRARLTRRNSISSLVHIHICNDSD